MKIILISILLSCPLFAQVEKDDSLLTETVEPKQSVMFQDEMPLFMIPYLGKTEKVKLFDEDINYTNFSIISGATLLTGVALHIYQRNSWWRNQRTKLHINNDWAYSLSADKVGHFYDGALLAHLFSGALEGSNFDSESSAIWGAALSLTFLLYVEVEDGYGPDWGFSPGDAGADFLGASYTLAQYYYPFLKNFMFKFSYLPSEKMRAGTHQGGNVFDDYEGHKYWLSLRVNEFLPSSIEKYWPDFLMIAGGMSVRNLDGSGGGQHEWYVALDFDAEQIPLYGPVWQFLKNTLNYVHFPMPGFRFSPDKAFFVLCF